MTDSNNTDLKQTPAENTSAAPANSGINESAAVDPSVISKAGSTKFPAVPAIIITVLVLLTVLALTLRNDLVQLNSPTDNIITQTPVVTVTPTATTPTTTPSPEATTTPVAAVPCNGTFSNQYVEFKCPANSKVAVETEFNDT